MLNNDLISRDAAIDMIANFQRELCPMGMYGRHAVYGSDRDKFDDWQFIIDELEKIPAVDAVQIVRCNDCKWWSATESKENDCDFYGVCEMHGRITLYNDFCQCGTKFDRDGDNDAAD